MTDRLLSLAAGTLPEFDPVSSVRAAAEAGWPACGIWYDATTWQPQTTQAVAHELRAGDISALDIEVIWLSEQQPVQHHRAVIDTGAALGVQHVLIVSGHAEPGRTQAEFAQLCEWCGELGLNACLEFLPITSVRTLPQALGIVHAVDHPAAKILVDPLHLQRSGAKPSDLQGLAPWMSYAQFCDGLDDLPQQTFDDLRDDALDGRLLPGEGALPLAQLLAELPPDLALSVELRSKRLRQQFSDPVDRARCVLLATQAYLQERV